ncbi:MAG TPA: hypothetical protein PLP42_21580, partial [Acidobacteriota bacterium]|nr:hypothetical protein [Acidobacteriota bacterium]
MLDRKVFLAVWMTVLIALAPAVLAQSGQTGTGSQQDQSATIGQSGTTSGQTTMSGEHGEVVQSATEVFRQIRQGGLPSSVLENASAVAVITSKSHGTMGSMHESTPQGTQGSTGTGSQSTTPGSQESMGTMAQSGQSGIVVRRNTDGTWDKTPAFIRWSGGSQSGGMSSSTGSQSSGMGMQSSTEGDLVLVFTGDDSLEALMDGNLDLSSEVTVTSGPTGTTGSTGMTGSTTGSTTGSGETTGSSQEGATS